MLSLGQKLIPVMAIEAMIIAGLILGFVMEWISLPVLIAGVLVASSFVAFFAISFAKQAQLGDGSPVDQDRINETEER